MPNEIDIRIGSSSTWTARCLTRWRSTRPATARRWRKSAPPSPTEYYAQYCNGGYYKSFCAPLLGGDPPPELVEQVHDRKKALYAACLGAARPNTALFALLAAMRPTAHLALVTTGSRRNATEILDHFHCRDWFELILTSEDVTNNKPDPEGYLAAMAHFGIDAAHTMIFEDSAPGLAAARAAAAAVFAVDRF